MTEGVRIVGLEERVVGKGKQVRGRKDEVSFTYLSVAVVEAGFEVRVSVWSERKVVVGKEEEGESARVEVVIYPALRGVGENEASR